MDSVTTDTIRPGGKKVAAPSTRHLVVDDRYAEILADELGVKITTARTAFIGEPQRRASEISGWALDNSADAAERARMILAWARKHRRGAFREVSDAEFRRSIARRS
jgi:hypothetical protein